MIELGFSFFTWASSYNWRYKTIWRRRILRIVTTSTWWSVSFFNWLTRAAEFCYECKLVYQFFFEWSLNILGKFTLETTKSLRNNESKRGNRLENNIQLAILNWIKDMWYLKKSITTGITWFNFVIFTEKKNSS